MAETSLAPAAAAVNTKSAAGNRDGFPRTIACAATTAFTSYPKPNSENNILAQNSKLKTRHSSTDYHCHLLPGMDDGAITIEDSIEMARKLMDAGFTDICCTPHLIKGIYDYSSQEIRNRTEQLQQQLAANSIELKLIAGAEYYLDEYLLKLLDDPLPLGDKKQLLIEIPGNAQIEYVKETCSRITCSGFTPLIAHPERCRLLEPRPGEPVKKSLWGSIFTAKYKPQDSTLLDHLRAIGCKFQGNLGSFAGIYGNSVREKAVCFLQDGLYECFGSDAHTPLHLEGLLQRGMQTVQLVQAEILAEGQTG